LCEKTNGRCKEKHLRERTRVTKEVVPVPALALKGGVEKPGEGAKKKKKGMKGS